MKLNKMKLTSKHTDSDIFDALCEAGGKRLEGHNSRPRVAPWRVAAISFLSPIIQYTTQIIIRLLMF